MDTRVLEELGLTPGEVKAYVALLTLGPSTTGPIAKESGVSRSKLYLILDKLEKKGLASHLQKGGVLVFQPVEPRKIKDLLAQKEEGLKSLQRRLDAALPNMEASYARAGRVQQVAIYQGLKGLITAHEHTYLKLQPGEEYVYIGVPKDQPTSHHAYWQRDHRRRIRAGIRCRVLFNRDTDRKILENRNSYTGCDARYLPVDIRTPAYYAVYKDTLLISIPTENPIAIEVTSQEIADAFLAFFEAFWKDAKPFH